MPLTVPNVTRAPPPGVAAAPNTTDPTAGPSPSAQPIGVAPAVSTAMTARSPSTSIPATVPVAVRPPGKVTVTSSPRTLWAFVRTWPSAATTPEPRRRDPMPTTEGVIVAVSDVRAWESSSSADMRWVLLAARGGV